MKILNIIFMVVRIGLLLLSLFFFIAYSIIIFDSSTLSEMFISIVIALLFLSISYLLLPKKYRFLNIIFNNKNNTKLDIVESLNDNTEAAEDIVPEIHETRSNDFIINQISTEENLSNDEPIIDDKDSDDAVNTETIDTKPTNTLDTNISTEKDLEVELNNVTSNNNSDDQNFKVVTIHSIVVGIKYEGRKKKLKDLIKELLEEDYYYSFQGFTNNEIKEMSYMYSYDSPLYEIEDESLPYCEIVPEPDNPYDSNAVAVFVGRSEHDKFQVGYLPKSDAERIKDLINNGEIVNSDAIITGGRYKFVETDEYGEEKLRSRTKDYLLNIEIVFKKHLK